MTHPSELYIKFIVAQKLALSEEVTENTVNIILGAFHLPKVNDQIFDYVLSVTKPKEIVKWYNPRHKYTSKWCKELDIDELRHPSETVKAALNLQCKPSIKEVIQILLMGRINLPDIVLRVNKRFKYEITEDVVECYAKYFWDVDKCSHASWYNILSDDVNRDQYMAALQGSKNQAVWRAGFNPVVDSGRALQDAYTMIVMRLDALRTAPDTKETADLTTKYTRELMALHSVCFGDGSQMSSTIKELKNIMVKKDSARAPGLRLISNDGSFSNSGRS